MKPQMTPNEAVVVDRVLTIMRRGGDRQRIGLNAAVEMILEVVERAKPKPRKRKKA